MNIKSEELQHIKKITNSAYDDLKLEFLYHSNHLEGSTFTLKNLEVLLYEKKVEGSHDYIDILETKNSLDVFDEIVDTINEEVSKLWILNLHRILKKGTPDEEIHNSGCWKKYENRMKGIDIKTAMPHEVDNLIENLIWNWQNSQKTIEDIAKFHAIFEHIHPFQDGNGRIGRFIIFKQCIEANIDLIAIDEQYNSEYRNNLYIAQKEENYIELINTFKKCQKD